MVKKSYHDLTIIHVLEYIASNTKSENQRIAKELDVNPENISRLTTLLAALNLVQKIQPDPEERRRVAWALTLFGLWTVLVWNSREPEMDNTLERIAHSQHEQWPLLKEHQYLRENRLEKAITKRLRRHYPIQAFKTKETFAKTHKALYEYMRQNQGDLVSVDQYYLNRIALGFSDLLNSTEIDPNLLDQLVILSQNPRLMEMIVRETNVQKFKLKFVINLLKSLSEEDEKYT